MRFFESININLNEPEQQVFRSATIPSLADETIELSTRCLLISKKLKEEVVNGVSTTEHENLKRKPVEFGKSLQFALDANLALTAQIKEISYVHSCCDVKKESLKDEICILAAEKLSLQAENEKLKGGLNDLSASKHVDSEKINRLEKDFKEAMIT